MAGAVGAAGGGLSEDDFCDATAVMTRSLYACPDVRTTHRLVRVNVNAPGETPGLFALKSAMDELASAPALDPLELRLRNHAETDGHDGRRFSSKTLRELPITLDALATARA